LSYFQDLVRGMGAVSLNARLQNAGLPAASTSTSPPLATGGTAPRAGVRGIVGPNVAPLQVTSVAIPQAPAFAAAAPAAGAQVVAAAPSNVTVADVVAKRQAVAAAASAAAAAAPAAAAQPAAAPVVSVMPQGGGGGGGGYPAAAEEAPAATGSGFPWGKVVLSVAVLAGAYLVIRSRKGRARRAGGG
jgi:hypothetical protein